MVVASTGIVDGQQDTEPIFAYFGEFAPSHGLSLLVEETELFGRLHFGKHGKSDSSDCSPGHKRTSTSLKAEAFETLRHGRTSGMLCQS